MDSIGLLDWLSLKCGCMYLSDLKKSSELPVIQHYIGKSM